MPKNLSKAIKKLKTTRKKPEGSMSGSSAQAKKIGRAVKKDLTENLKQVKKVAPLAIPKSLETRAKKAIDLEVKRVTKEAKKEDAKLKQAAAKKRSSYKKELY